MVCFAHQSLGTRILTMALGLLLALGGATVATPANAQGFGWLGTLFGGPPRPPNQPRAPGYDQRPDGNYARPRVLRHHASEPARAPRDKDRPPPKNASVFVYVIGDAFGQNLASGLDDALADRLDVAIIHKAKGSTGLVTTDFFDWPKAVDAMLSVEAKKPKSAGDTGQADPGKSQTDPGKNNGADIPIDPAAKDKAKADPPDAPPIDIAVMMIGSNDRQAIRLQGATLKPGTQEWRDEYSRRVVAIDEAFRRKGIPLIWVGVPIARDDGFADDMAAFNDIYREAAAKTGTVFVDTWEAFSDDNGDFSAVGPDINGQITRLRMADGIYFTKAGSRKLAHFVEAHVRRALDGKMARPPIPEAPAPRVAPARKPDVGPVSNLADPPLSRGGQLAAAYRADAQLETSIVKGSPQPAPAGRADDLTWPASGMPNP